MFADGEHDPSNFESWTKLFSEYDSSSYQSMTQTQLMELARYYQTFLEYYPYLHIYWAKYAQLTWHLSQDLSSIEGVFQQALDKTKLGYSIDMWKEYLKYYATYINIIPQGEIRLAYAKALDAIGWHYQSYSIYNEAIEFERSEGREPLFYMVKAIQNPINNLSKIYTQLTDLLKVVHISYIINCNMDKTFEDYISSPFEMDISIDNENEVREEFIRKIDDIFHNTNFKLGTINKYEKRISQSFFHIYLPDQSEISGWEMYIDYLILSYKSSPSKDTYIDVIRLFERAIIPNAYVGSIWVYYAQFVEENQFGGIDEARTIYQRIPAILYKCQQAYAGFEEEHNIEAACALYHQLEMSDYAENVIFASNFYLRQGDQSMAQQVLINAYSRFLNNGDSCGYDIIGAELLRRGLEIHSIEPLSVSADSQLKLFQAITNKLPDDDPNLADVNVKLYAATYGMASEDAQIVDNSGYHATQENGVMLDEKIHLLRSYIEFCRERGIEANFQLNAESDFNSLCARKSHYEDVFRLDALCSNIKPEDLELTWMSKVPTISSIGSHI